MLALLAVLLIVGGAAIAGLLAVRLDAREQVVVVGQDIAQGEQITAAMLQQTPVAGDNLMVVPVDQVEDVIGTYARVPIVDGQLLDTSMLTRQPPVAEGRAQVGVPLTSGRIPTGLESGDLVRLVRTSDGGGAEPLAVGLVLSTSSTTAGGLVDEEETSSGASLLVDADAADAVVDAAANDQLGMALLQSGVAVDEAPLESLVTG